MAKNSAIEWTDATVNFWWGCTKVGPGCDHCYAEAWSKRTGASIWGVGASRRMIKSAGALIAKLQASASHFEAAHGRRRRVFVQSMSDLFDLEVNAEWFGIAIDRIEAASRLDIQIVTKRISVVEKRLAEVGRVWPRNAGLIISVVNQAEANRDIPRLLDLKRRLGISWVGLSMEPLLGPVDLSCVPAIGRAGWLCPLTGKQELSPIHADHTGAKLDWIIVGGESGPGARPMHPDWPRGLRDQCAAAGVPFLFKQWGEWAPGGDWIPNAIGSEQYAAGRATVLHSGVTHGRGYFPEHACRAAHVTRVGKKAAGRLLDGVQHDGYPTSSGGEPEAAPVTDLDAPADAPAGVSAPKAALSKRALAAAKPETVEP